MTDVSKAADAVFVMLMPSLLTAQRVTLLRGVERHALVSPFTRNAVSISFLSRLLFSRGDSEPNSEIEYI